MPKYIDIREFREIGFLQEANRQFFHPLGLALEIRVNDDGTESLSGVWDYRDDPEGVTFEELSGPEDNEKANRVLAERIKHVRARAELFGTPGNPVQQVAGYEHWDGE